MSFKLTKNDNWSEIAHHITMSEIQAETKIGFYSEIDLSRIEKIRAVYKEIGLPKPSYTAFIVKAVSEILKENPQHNRRLFKRFWKPFGKMEIQNFSNVDITVQVEKEVDGSETATFADVLRSADMIPLRDVQVWLKKLAESNQDNNEQWKKYSWIVSHLPMWVTRVIVNILPTNFPDIWEKYRGGAVLVNSPARYGVDFLVGTWPWPLTISFGLVKERPIIKENKVVPVLTVMLILNFDRRIIAGAQAARFFKSLIDCLENFNESDLSKKLD